ncbi:hypothetical protein COB57_02695 [Candidatus Peregrinibacteria bacterium]|nr:MAG: hypothetical protein COB57_02695 [Candidatus Peregrinibacteria bacterium]
MFHLAFRKYFSPTGLFVFYQLIPFFIQTLLFTSIIYSLGESINMHSLIIILAEIIIFFQISSLYKDAKNPESHHSTISQTTLISSPIKIGIMRSICLSILLFSFFPPLIFLGYIGFIFSFFFFYYYFINTYIFIPEAVSDKTLHLLSLKPHSFIWKIAYLLIFQIMFPGFILISQGTSFIHIGFFIIGICMFFTYIFWIKKSISQVYTHIEHILHGHFRDHIAVHSFDEIGKLQVSVNEVKKAMHEKKYMKNLFGKMVGTEVRDYVLSGHKKLGGAMIDTSVLFSDIRGFTSLSEKFSPQEMVLLLNGHFECMNQCIHKHHGMIDKFIGDAIMVLFGAPLPQKNHAESSVLVAIDMMQQLNGVNEALAKINLPPINIGIGIHSGPVLAGNIGSHDRMEYTVIGDTVNQASRIEGLCKKYPYEIIISEDTYNQLTHSKDKAVFLDETFVKGKSETIKIYGVKYK